VCMQEDFSRGSNWKESAEGQDVHILSLSDDAKLVL
jgi:hypothetical protein